MKFSFDAVKSTYKIWITYTFRKLREFMKKESLDDQKQYKNWLVDIKQRLHSVQMKAIVAVNRQLLLFYWQLGADIVSKQEKSYWGSGFLKQLSADLMAEFPEIKGFSKRNLELIRRWYLFWSEDSSIAKQAVSLIGQQAVIKLEEKDDCPPIVKLISRIPWGHNLKIISKCPTVKEALFYVQSTISNNWSRNVLVHQIESKLYEREGQAVNNFQLTLPETQSDLAKQTLKDPYVFDFLTLTKDFKERELELGLLEHLEKFLLELGQGFAFVGRQYGLTVSDQDFYLDLLFYHLELRCFIVIDLKAGAFKAEYAGKMNFYCAVVDDLLKKEHDAPTLGLILCKSKNKLVAEYALRGVKTPIGVSEYELTQALPEELQSSLPSIEAIEKELGED